MVIEEFGRCLLQIIESANKTKGLYIVLYICISYIIIGSIKFESHKNRVGSVSFLAVVCFTDFVTSCEIICCDFVKYSIVYAHECHDVCWWSFEQVAVLSLTYMYMYSIKICRKHRHMIAWSWIQPCVIPAQVPAPVYPVPCLCVCVHVFVTVSDLSLTVFSEREQMWDIEC